MSDTVTKREIVIDIANKTGLTQTEVKEIVEELIISISDILERNESIEIRGFGTFYPKIRKPRPARNIHTGQVVPLQERAVPLFRYSNNMKEKINNALLEEKPVEDIFHI
ncbi:MAG: HU family DNA-binding protein [Fibrobacterota bacterium]